MDFIPGQEGHNIGINYAQTGAGWLLSPQFRPNEELFEIRYQWEVDPYPLIEFRVRWREALEKRLSYQQKPEEFDLYLRMTWQFSN